MVILLANRRKLLRPCLSRLNFFVRIGLREGMDWDNHGIGCFTPTRFTSKLALPRPEA